MIGFTRLKCWTLALLLAAQFTTGSQVNAQQVDVVKRLRVVLAMDLDAKELGNTISSDRRVLLDVLNEIREGRPNRIEIEEIPRDQMSPDGVLNYLKKMTLLEGDGLFFYYSGHGGWDTARHQIGARQVEKGHFLAMDRGNLLRSDLISTVLSKQPIAAFVISDSCSNLVHFDVPVRRKPAKWAGFRNLFFQNVGLYDIQCATRAQFGWGGVGNSPGMFTGVFAKLLCEPRSSLTASKRDEDVTWSDFFDHLRSGTLEVFHNAKKAEIAAGRERRKIDIRDQLEQTPQAFSLGGWPGVIAEGIPADALYRLGSPAAFSAQPKSVTFAPDGGWTILFGRNGHYFSGAPKGAAAKLGETVRENKHALQHAAYGPNGKWCLFYGHNGATYAGIPEECADVIQKVHKDPKKPHLQTIAFNGNDGWVMIWGKNCYWARGVPEKFFVQLKKLSKEGHQIRDVAFTPSGGWVILFDTNGWYCDGVPPRFFENMEKLSKQNLMVHTVAFHPSGGWCILHVP